MKHCKCWPKYKHHRSHYWVEYIKGINPHSLKERLFCYRGLHEQNGWVRHVFSPTLNNRRGYLLLDKEVKFASSWFMPLVIDLEGAREDEKDAAT